MKRNGGDWHRDSRPSGRKRPPPADFAGWPQRWRIPAPGSTPRAATAASSRARTRPRRRSRSLSRPAAHGLDHRPRSTSRIHALRSARQCGGGALELEARAAFTGALRLQNQVSRQNTGLFRPCAPWQDPTLGRKGSAKMQIIGLIIEIIAGIIGGNAAGAAAKNANLGTAGNSISAASAVSCSGRSWGRWASGSPGWRPWKEPRLVAPARHGRADRPADRGRCRGRGADADRRADPEHDEQVGPGRAPTRSL